MRRDTAARDRLLTVREVAERLGISLRSVWTLAAAGALPRIRIAGRSTRFAPMDVDALIERGRTQGGI
jgi:excisionase family DNA binding protein